MKPTLEVWRVVLATEDAVDHTTGNYFPGVQHVAFVVTPNRQSIGRIIFEDETLKHLTGIPRIVERLQTDLPLWPYKIGAPNSLECLYGVAAANDPADVLGIVRKQFADREPVLDMLDMGWLRVGPSPIDVTRVGVW